MAQSNYLKDNKKIQIVHDSECCIAAGIYFCDYSAELSQNLDALLLFYLNKRVILFNSATSSLAKGSIKKTTVVEKPYLTVFIIYGK